MSSLYKRTCHDATYTYDHILIAEQMLGRKLKPGETVHHIDHNKRNNSSSNLMVFSTVADHTSYHASNGVGYLIKNNDGSYCFLADPPKLKCPVCGRMFYKNQISYQSRFCSDECRNVVTGKGKCPPYYELKSLCRNMNNCQIARMFNVSDKAVGKWKKKYNL